MAHERFADPALLILTSLAAGERHGYAIMDDAKTQFGVQMGPGTLYATLARLEERGLIELFVDSCGSADAVQAGASATPRNQRRPYRLTEKGEAVLREELSRLSHLTHVARGRLEKAVTP